MAFVETHVDSGLGVITMIDSENGNRLNEETLQELSQAFNSLIKKDDVQVLLLRSDGNPFCLGMDINYLLDVEGNPEIIKVAVELYSDLLLKIYKAPKPVISLINGDVKAGGVGLAAACDIIFASEKSTFQLSEVLLGLLPANVLPFLLSLRLSPQKARYLVLTAKKLTAGEAKMLNLVDEVYPEERLEKETRSVIRTLFRAAPDALTEAKRFTESILYKDIDMACNMAKAKLLELISKTEVMEAISSFNQGEVPTWFTKFRPKKPIVK